MYLYSGRYHIFFVKWCQQSSTYAFIVNWNYTGVSSTPIPSSNFYLPTLVGSSPYSITVYSVCGDGYKSSGENWDDGNLTNGDGWSSTWTVESTYTWYAGGSSSKSVCEIWGDGVRINSYGWDDGNTVSGDCWDSTWNIESICIWSGGNSTSKDTWEVWGDGIRMGVVQWDDGNRSYYDGWDYYCRIESGWNCSGGSTTSKDVCVEIWGDGRRYNSLSTYCDDQNVISSDGCSSIWSVEAGWTCSGGSSSKKDSCTEICGDGIRFNSINTYCDDGNASNSDGCSSSCSIETGWSWAGGSITSKDACVEIWGDGIRFNTNTNYCDDGNKNNGDGWDSSWSVEAGWTCSGGSSIVKDSWSDICGDGIILGQIECDDGNKNNGDGWSSTCSIEVGWNWSGGSSSNKDICTEICGDGKRFNSVSTYWDDENTSNGDGCSSTWTIEPGWSCSGGNSTNKDSWSDICGDGKKYASISTFWDDGNKISGDGWSSTWTIELGWNCSGGSSSSKDTWTEVWGDGKRFNSLSNYWDDGNTSSGDGCNSTCLIESGWNCSGDNSSSKDTCSDICGDGVKYTSLSTFWDDGNTVSNDGWNSTWSVETGWCCSGGSPTSKDSWSEIWGDGKRFNLNSTYWDDGNTSNNDGWNSSCLIEAGWTWTGGNSSIKDTCIELWGDSIRFNTMSTYWDDGNTANGDGWDSSCLIETGWTCSGGNSSSKDTCGEVCGDGIRFNSSITYWDDGNTSVGDGWNSSCTIETGWSCLGGNSLSKDMWSEIWGDGIRFNPKSTYWDDGNTVNGDGWDSSCATEANWSWFGGTTTTKDTWGEFWGDGIKFNTLSTYWDDGNTFNNDGWSSKWIVETGWLWNGGNSSNKDIWTEIWGDGIQFNVNSTYWDDGNVLNGDGWSFNWSIETGWTCIGGNSTTKDICKEKWGDGIRFNSKSTYWDDGNVINDDGCNMTCEIEPGYKWTEGNSTSKSIWTKLIVITAAETAAVQSTQSAVGAGVSVSAGVSLLSMSSPVSIFSMMNQFQLMYFLLVSGAYVSDGVFSVITGMSFSMLNFDFLKIEKIPYFDGIYRYLTFDQPNEKLNNLGIISGSTFVNIMKTLLSILLIILIHF